MNMSPQLAEFYIELDLWLREADDEMIFNASMGLCDNLDEWAVNKGHNPKWLNDELIRSFLTAGLDANFPFNRDGDDYNRESNSFGIFFNKARLLWIRDRLQRITGRNLETPDD